MRKIQLTRGKVALVDDVDYEWLNQWKWCAETRGGIWYAKRSERVNGKKRSVLMHRVILGLEYGNKLMGDHKNHNGLDNRRDNIRTATYPQNSANKRKHYKSKYTSRYLGVSYEEDRKKWRASVTGDKSPRFDSEKEAAKWYNAVAKIKHGEFANLNKI